MRRAGFLPAADDFPEAVARGLFFSSMELYIVRELVPQSSLLMAQAYDQAIYSVRLRPHRSLTRGQANMLVFVVSATICAISLPFFFMGAWPIVGFLGLDALGIWAAFELSFRAARAYEDLRLTPLELKLDKVPVRGQTREFRFNPFWVRLDRSDHEEFGLQRLALVSHGRSVEFGSFLGPEQKAAVAGDLSLALARARRGPDLS